MKKFYLFLLTMMVSLVSFAQINEGEFYIQNVESGLYLSGANSWGTQASATVNGEAYYVAALTDGGYTITGTLLSSASKTLGYDLYVDTNTSRHGNVWTIAPVAGEDGVYTIYGKGKKDKVEDAFEGYVAQSETAGAVIGYVLESVAEVTDAAKWRFITKEQAIAGIKSGDNISFLFDNPNFSRSHATSVWIVDEGCTNKNLGNGQNNNYCAESLGSKFNIHQTITGVPNGTYSMTVQGFYRNDFKDGETHEAPVFYANDEEIAIPVMTGEMYSMADASTSFTKGLYTIEPIEFEVTDGTITLGVKSDESEYWCIWDNFQVTAVNVAAPEPVIDQLVLINGEEEYALNTHSAVPVEAQTAMTVSFAAAVKAATYTIQPIVGYDEQSGDPILGVPTWGEFSINTTGYAEQNYAYKQGVQYMITVEATLMDDTQASEQFLINGAQVAEPLPATITCEGTTLNVTYAVGTDLGDNYAVKPYILDANEQQIEVADYVIDNTTGGFFDPLNLIVITLNEELTDGDYTLVLPEGMFIVNGGDNNEEWPYEFTVGNPALAVSLIADEETEYALITHSTITVDMPVSAIKVAGLDQTMGEVTYAIYDKRNELASGTLSINTIGYAEFAPVTMYEGVQYNIVITLNGETTLFDGYVIGAAEEEPAEIAVVLVAEDETEYALISHSTVTVDVPVKGIAVEGLQVNPIDEVTYAIYDKRNTIAEGTLSINNKAAYAEFDNVVDLYEGIQYNVVITLNGETTLFDGYVIGAMEEPVPEIFATIIGDEEEMIALNSHSAVPAEIIKAFEVSFEGFAPKQVGYSINTLKLVAGEESSSWEIDETLAQGALSLNGKGYAEFENAIILEAGTKYALIINADNESATFEINGACELALKATLAITESKYATFVAPYAVNLPEGVTAYTVEKTDDNNATLIMEEVKGKLPANTPVVVYSEKPVEKEYYQPIVEGIPQKGIMVGVLVNTDIRSGYVLQNQNGLVGFYQVSGIKTVPANRAYIAQSASTDGIDDDRVKAYFFDTTTAIKALNAMAAGKAEIYDLNGRQQSRLQKGVNIVNGVKVLVK